MKVKQLFHVNTYYISDYYVCVVYKQEGKFFRNIAYVNFINNQVVECWIKETFSTKDFENTIRYVHYKEVSKSEIPEFILKELHQNL